MTTEEGGGILPLTYPYRILSIDLGETTGLALFDLATRVLRCASTKNPLQIFPILTLLDPAILILERMPGSMKLEFEAAISYQKLSSIQNIILISPGDWKPFMKSRKWNAPEASNQHEQDAVDILRYYLITKEL